MAGPVRVRERALGADGRGVGHRRNPPRGEYGDLSRHWRAWLAGGLVAVVAGVVAYLILSAGSSTVAGDMAATDSYIAAVYAYEQAIQGDEPAEQAAAHDL